MTERASRLAETQKKRLLLLQGCVQFYATGQGRRAGVTPVGFGCLIHERGIVVTCLHVLGQALFNDKELPATDFLKKLNPRGKPPTSIEVAYLSSSVTAHLTARVLNIQPLLDMDICLLELQERLPLEATVLPLLSSNHLDTASDGCEVPDFLLSQNKKGSWQKELRTVCGTPSLDGGAPGTDRMRITGRSFKEGHSGAPIFSLAHGRVCGILCRANAEYATAVPIEDIIDASPDDLHLSCRPPSPPRVLAMLQRDQDLALDKLHTRLKDLDRAALLSYPAAFSPPCPPSILEALKALPSLAREDFARRLATEPELAVFCVHLLRRSDSAQARDVGWRVIHAWSRLATETMRTGHHPPSPAVWAALCGMLEVLLKDEPLVRAGQTAPKESEHLAEKVAETIGLVGERELSFHEGALDKAAERVMVWVDHGRAFLGNLAVEKAGAELSIIEGSCHRCQGHLGRALAAYDKALRYVEMLKTAEGRSIQLAVQQEQVDAGKSSQLPELSTGILELLKKLSEQPALFLVLSDRLPHHVGLLALAVGERLDEARDGNTAMELAVGAFRLFERTQSLRAAADVQLLIGRLWRARAERERAVPAHKTAARAALCAARSRYQQNAFLYGVALADRELLLLELFTNSLTTDSARARACADFETLIFRFGQHFTDEAAAAALRILFGSLLLEDTKLAEARDQLVRARAYFETQSSQDSEALGAIAETLISVYAREDSAQEVVREYKAFMASAHAEAYKLQDEAHKLYAQASVKLSKPLVQTDPKQALSLLKQALAAQLLMAQPEPAERDRRISLIGQILLDPCDELELAARLLDATPQEAVRVVESFLSRPAEKQGPLAAQAMAT